MLSPGIGFSGGGLHESEEIAIDASGNIWVTNFQALVSKLSSNGMPVTGSPFSGGGVGNPVRIAIDGAGNAWIGNFSGTVSELSNSGVALSPSSGFGGSVFDNPDYGLSVDGSGNLWVPGGNSAVEFVGIATPVVTPLSVGVRDNKLGTRP